MFKEIDYEKRRTVLHRLPLIAGALVLAPSLLIPSEAQAYDLKYKNYSLPNNASLEKFLGKMDYPNQFEFCYEIPENGDRNGDRLQGNFRLTRNPKETTLSIEIKHPRESKIVTLSETRNHSSGIIFYSESDFDTARGEVKYNSAMELDPLNKPKTAISLVEDLINGTIHSQDFVFQGNSSSLNKFSLEAKTTDEEGYDLVREAKVKGDSPRIPSLRVLYKAVNGIQIPVEIHVDYKVKAFDIPLIGSIYVTPTLIGVLQAYEN